VFGAKKALGIPRRRSIGSAGCQSTAGRDITGEKTGKDQPSLFTTTATDANTLEKNAGFSATFEGKQSNSRRIGVIGVGWVSMVSESAV
jgi:hypothetical protein